MGMSNVLGAALSGLRTTQAGLDLLSRNIANADQPGYTRKTLENTPLVAGGKILGVRTSDATRQLDSFVLRQMWREVSGAGYIDTMARYFTHVDTMLGTPGSPANLDSLYNTFLASLEALTASPDAFTARDQVLRDAQALAQTLNRTSDDIQAMRLEAERGIADAVREINELLAKIARLNRDIGAVGDGAPPPDLLDMRDRHIAELSRLVDLKVIERDSGAVALMTRGGALLLDDEPGELVFDERGALTAQSLYSRDDAERGVGTIRLRSPGGMTTDLIEDRALRSGALAALVELRDTHLVRAQAQLDAFADGLARALSSNTVDGTQIGGPAGWQIDPAGLQSGDRIELVYDDGGQQKRVTIIRVEDPDSLPLGNDATPDPDDLVIGVSLSAGLADAASDITAALQGQGIDIAVGTDGGLLQFLDGADNSVAALSASVTATGFGEGPGLPFFLDGEALYTGSLDGTPQQLGFAGRIRVNPALLADNAHLVRQSATTPIGDPARPIELLRRLSQEQYRFGAQIGVSGSADYSDSLGGFLQRIISFQGAQSADTKRAKEAQDVVVAQLEERFTRKSGVNLDEEMARLIELQTAFQANTRIVQAYREMLAMLMQM